MMGEILLSGLLLPLRLYLQPNAFREQVAALAPDLPNGYSLWRARHKLGDPAFRSGLGRLILQSIVALLWGPLVASVVLGVLSALGTEVDWIQAAGGVAFGVVRGVALGVVFGVALGAAVGVAGGVAFGVTFGVALGVARGVAVGVPSGVALGVASGVALAVAGGMADGVAVGVVLGVAVGVVGGVASGVAVGVMSALTVTHALNLPLQYLIGVTSWALLRVSPGLSVALWRCSPVRWDEVILPPLPGLVGLLVALYRTDPAQGRAALAEVAAHRYQRRAAQKALVRLADEDARLVASPAALAAFGRGLDWLSEETPLPDRVRNLVLGMRDVSREVASALESDSATNRVRRLEAAAGMLDSLRLHPGELGSTLARWAEIVSAELEEARRRQRVEEPVPQVYVSDGRPIRPPARAEAASPFKGRETLFGQLEAALGGAEGQRATLLLYGQRRTGKTSVLLHLPRRLGSRVVPAFLDMQSGKLGGAKDVVGLMSGLADEVVDEARRHRGVGLPAIDRGALRDDAYPALDRWLDQVERVLAERVLLLCLDEFEELEKAIQDGRIDTRILSTLRNVVQHRRRIAVLLSGSHQIDELAARWASTLITTVTLPISFLEEGDTRALIEHPVDGFPAIYRPAAVDRIVQITHCQPFLVQLTCALLVKRMNAARRVPPESFVGAEDVDAVIPLALERGQGYFVDLWGRQAGGDVARRVLEALACAPGMRMDRVGLRAIERDEGALRGAIATLLRREIIERVDDDYRILVPLVGEYARQQVLV